MSKQALANLRVLEFAELISGPYCSRLLADLGAEVIKIERPDGGDRARTWAPLQENLPESEQSGLFLFLNVNKKSVTLDVETPQGMAAFRELIAKTDIFVENNPPALMERLGLTYAELSKINPRLIMVSITPFGQTGPYRDYKSTELVTFHMSGLGYETPRAVDPKLVDNPPLKGGGYFAGFFAAVNAAGAALAALYARRRDGVGQAIDISEQQCLIPLLRRAVAIYLYDGRIATRFMHTWKVAPHHFMQCKDGYVFASIVEEHQWERLVEVMGNPEWAKGEVFQDGASRLEHWDQVEPFLSEWLMQRTKDEVWRETQAQGVPFAPVNLISDLLQSPHLLERQFFLSVPNAAGESVVIPGTPYKFSETPARVAGPAPRLGEHNAEILGERLGQTV